MRACRAAREVGRGLRLLQEGSAPAGLRRARPAKPPLVRYITNETVPTPCCSCERQILELRKEMLAENQRVWKMYEGLLEVNHSMLEKMGQFESEAAKRQIATLEAMAKTSYTIIGSGGAFLMGIFVVMSPLLMASWQQETLDAWEKKALLRKVDAVLEGTGPKGTTDAGGNGDGTTSASASPQDTEGSKK